MCAKAQTPASVTLPAGIWHSKYRYPSSVRHGVYEAEHFVQLRCVDNGYVIESLPNSRKTRLVVRFSVTGTIATGTWREDAPKDSDGTQPLLYHGALQMVIDEDGQRMAGKWVGFGRDMNVNVGSWEFTFVGSKLPVGL